MLRRHLSLVMAPMMTTASQVVHVDGVHSCLNPQPAN
jgi:hypothetical protein